MNSENPTWADTVEAPEIPAWDGEWSDNQIELLSTFLMRPVVRMPVSYTEFERMGNTVDFKITDKSEFGRRFLGFLKIAKRYVERHPETQWITDYNSNCLEFKARLIPVEEPENWIRAIRHDTDMSKMREMITFYMVEKLREHIDTRTNTKRRA